MTTRRFVSVDEYIESFPAEVQAELRRFRETLRHAVPTATETIRYDIPALTLDGAPLLHFAGWKHHISVYPAPTGDDQFERDIAPYRSAKSTLKFPLGEPVPAALLERIVALRIEQQSDRPATSG